MRRDAARNQQRILQAAEEVLGESGAEAGIEQIAARAGVGVGSIYRRFASKEALIDELLRSSTAALSAVADAALARRDGTGLEQMLQEIGRTFATHRLSADLMLEPPVQDDPGVRRLRAQLAELTADAAAAGTIRPDVTFGDVLALVWGMRGVVHASGAVAPDAWRRFLDLHLAGLRPGAQPSSSAALTARQLSQLAPRASRR